MKVFSKLFSITYNINDVILKASVHETENIKSDYLYIWNISARFTVLATLYPLFNFTDYVSG